MKGYEPDVVHIGSACRDLTDDDPRGWRLGGGASYAALTTARLGLRTSALVGVDPLAGSAAELDLLRDSGVELVLVPLVEGPVFHNRETPAGRVQTSLAAGQRLPISGLPDHWRGAAAWSLVPVAAELDEAWLSLVPDRTFVSLAWQGLLRWLVAGREVTRLQPTPGRLVRRADLVGASRHDLGPEANPPHLMDLLRPGARLVVTDGPGGGELLERDETGNVLTRRYGAFAAEREVDPTGAGDVFLAALVMALVRESLDVTDQPRYDDALRFAAAAASFVVEAHGLLGVPYLGDVRARLTRELAADPSDPSNG